MKKVILTGKTLKGKNRIRENGNEWLIVRTLNTVLFSDKRGPWAMIIPADEEGDSSVLAAKSSRWVCMGPDGDEDFDIVEGD